jgi:hypothetical protein
LTSNGKTFLVSRSAIGSDFLKTFDVSGNLTTEVSFDDEPLEFFTDEVEFGF